MIGRIFYLLVIVLELSLSQGNNSGQDDDDLQSLLEPHNRARQIYGGVPNLTYDRDLAAMGRQWAYTLCQQNKFYHGGAPNCGQNLFWAFGSDRAVVPDYHTCVDSWVAEAQYYNFAKPPPGVQKNTGHFTQVVWKNTSRVGCGKATSPDGLRVYVACNYKSPGNYAGRFAQNVFPPRGTQRSG